MPKLHYSLSPQHVQRRIAMVRETDSIIRAAGSDQTFSVPAAGVLGAMQVAHLAGYSWPVEDVPTPATDQLRKLEKTADGAELARFRVRNSFALDYEARCVRKALSLERWAAEPSAAEVAEAERPERERLEREAAIELRALEIMTADKIRRSEAARVKARKELENA